MSRMDWSAKYVVSNQFHYISLTTLSLSLIICSLSPSSIFTLLCCIVTFSKFMFPALFQIVHVTFAFNFYYVQVKYLRLWIFLAGPCLWCCVLFSTRRIFLVLSTWQTNWVATHLPCLRCCVLFSTRRIFLVLSTWQTNWVATHLSCSDGKNFSTNSQIFFGCIFLFLPTPLSLVESCGGFWADLKQNPAKSVGVELSLIAETPFNRVLGHTIITYCKYSWKFKCKYR